MKSTELTRAILSYQEQWFQFSYAYTGEREFSAIFIRSLQRSFVFRARFRRLINNKATQSDFIKLFITKLMGSGRRLGHHSPWKILEALSPLERLMVVMRSYQGYSVEELSVIFQKPVGTVLETLRCCREKCVK